MGQRFGLKPGRSEKSLDIAMNLTSITHSSIQARDYKPQQLYYQNSPITVSLILTLCRSNLKLCCVGRKVVFLSVGI